MDDRARERPALRRIRPARTSDYVYEELRQAIRLHAFAPRHRLPPERELAHRLGVSMLTLRVALRRLESEGYISIRRGRGGGAFVQHVDDLDAAFKLERLRAGRVETEEALITRSIIEPAAVAHVARSPQPALAETLDRLVARMGAAESDEEFESADIEFHRTLIAAAGSALLSDTMDRVRGALVRALDALPAGRSWYQESNAGHRAIAEALRLGDATLAGRAARTHADGTERAVRLLLDPGSGERQVRARRRVTDRA